MEVGQVVQGAHVVFSLRLYDILSLGLLNFQVRSVTVQIEDQPSGCLEGLNSTQQNIAVGSALLLNVTHSTNTTETSRKTEVVCVAMIIDEQEIFPSVECHQLQVQVRDQSNAILQCALKQPSVAAG